MKDCEVARWLHTLADMLDNARDMTHGAVIRLDLSRQTVQEMALAANQAVDLLFPEQAVYTGNNDLRLPSFRFERRQAG